MLEVLRFIELLSEGEIEVVEVLYWNICSLNMT